MLRRFLIVPLLLLAACAGDKYPYPPQFVAGDAIPVDALGAPPMAGSPRYEAEIRNIVKRQAHLTAQQKAVLAQENHIAPEMLVLPVLGPHYTEARYPQLYALLKQAGSDSWRLSDAAEEYWNSPRPWYADARVHLYVPQITQPGYPSGHTTTNGVWARVLGDLFPAKRQALLARAWAIGEHRVDGGAHFPHDVEGGKRLSALIYARMQDAPQYQAEFAAARAEIRARAH